MARKIWLWLAGILLVLVAIFLVFLHYDKRSREKARAQWKDATLPRLDALAADTAAIGRELEDTKALGLKFGGPQWIGDKVLAMTNGEYLIFASRHGFNNGFINHLFLAHGSNGKWLYSTYHFCNSMMMIAGEDPPGSIAEFSKRYAVREFDGKSDVCLEKTWPE